MSKDKSKGFEAIATETNPRDFENDPVNKSLSSEQKINFLKEMLRIRRFEERSLRAYQQGKIGGFLHLYIGQESVAVGSLSVCGDNDHVITAYRDHGHALAAGMNMNECMAEMFGKYTGCSKGKGGSMHFFAPDKNYWGGHGIVAGQTPLGLGLAYGLKYKNIKGAALCYMGDGAVNQGVFHESLNLASLFNLPVVYIIENNGYSMGTSLERSSAYTDSLGKRAEAYKIEWDTVQGHLVYEVRAKVNEAIQRAHEESRPTILEIITYRYRGHSIADANADKYRTKAEVKEYQEKKDPINVWRNLLIEDKILTEEEAKAMDKEIRKEAEAAADFADKSPYPPTETIIDDVYWTHDNPDEHDNQGRIFFNDDWGPQA